MTITRSAIFLALAFETAVVLYGQTPAGTYQPGVTYQAANPNYPVRNPFYFEGRIDWNLLKIDQPANAWEFAQRGIHKQDDLEDIPGAIADYRQAISLNNLGNGTCQLITSLTAGQSADPPPCMFTVRARLGRLLMHDSPDEALQFFQEVLNIDPLRLGIHTLMAETYALKAEQDSDDTEAQGLRVQSVGEYQEEIKLSPVRDVSGDQANNAHVHWALAEIYDKLGRFSDEVSELDLYMKATKWHSDTYPWRIQLAQKKMEMAEAKMKSSANNNN